MILFPAIDLKEGLAVRLEQGDMARAKAKASNICTSSISTAPSPASR